jgi:hypothetical protein
MYIEKRLRLLKILQSHILYKKEKGLIHAGLLQTARSPGMDITLPLGNVTIPVN